VQRAEKRGAEELAKREREQLDAELQARRSDAESHEERAREARRAKEVAREELQALKEQLAVLQTDKRRADESLKRTEAQLFACQEAQATATRAMTASDEQCRQVVHEKELSLAEVARLELALAEATSERLRIDGLASQTEVRTKQELSASHAHASFAEERCKELVKEAEGLREERTKAQEQLHAAVGARKAAEEQVSVSDGFRCRWLLSARRPRQRWAVTQAKRRRHRLPVNAL